MAFSKSHNLACLMLIMAFMAAIGIHRSEAQVSCNAVYNSLYPCLGYIIGGGGGTVPDACCNGVRGLYYSATTKQARQGICVCLKNIASSGGSSGYISNAAGIPGKCGVNLPYKISPNIDCSRVY